MANPWAKRLSAPTEPTESQVVKTAVREAVAENDAVDGLIDSMPPAPEIIPAEEAETRGIKKLSKLVDDDFPFDESQLAAIDGMVSRQYACLTGAAGTGKTTTTKKLVDTLQKQERLSYVDMREYFKRGDLDDTDTYEMPEARIPAIAMVGFTGRSSQMIKKNFPRDWHGNIMTIHRLLAFVPEYYEDWDDELDAFRQKMRFSPTYTADNRLPWDIVIIDEAGMVGLDLWHQLWAAMKPGARVYMIGDINQLPPVHGRSIFGFALAKWASFELTHIHRQVGDNNQIVENAWRVLKGVMPISAGNFQMLELKGDANFSSRQVRGLIPKLVERKAFDPILDTIITPINGHEGARGFALGQLPLNAEFALIFNPASQADRYIIDGGRERKHFAVGDKVMATKNDHEAGVTNGMTGIITDIAPHPGYGGDHRRFGRISDVNAYYLEEDVPDDTDFSLESLSESMDAVEEANEKKGEKRDRGPSSHIVNVRFGHDEHAFELPFATLSEVGSLMTAYVVTCHKMQGGESPTVVIIVHDAHRQMLYREWLYTAITRASGRCILLYSPTALRVALNKQNIKGSTLKQKIDSFNALQTNNGLGVALKVILPEPPEGEGPDDDGGSSVRNHTLPALVDAGPGDRSPVVSGQATAPTVFAQRVQEERVNPLSALIGKRITIKVNVTHEHIHIHEASAPAQAAPTENPAHRPIIESVRGNSLLGQTPRLALPAPERQLLLTFRPSPAGVVDSTEGIQSRPLDTRASKGEAPWSSQRVAEGFDSTATQVQPAAVIAPVVRNNPWAKKLGKV